MADPYSDERSQPPAARDDRCALGGGGDGGGGSSGGGSSGSRVVVAAPADPLAAYRQTLLSGCGSTPGPFVQLMSQAAQENWSSAEFLWALEDDKAFQRRFPGVSALLRQGMSVPTAVGPVAADVRRVQGRRSRTKGSDASTPGCPPSGSGCGWRKGWTLRRRCSGSTS